MTSLIRTSDLLAPAFHSLYADWRAHRHTHYWLMGGRGSTKSTTASLALILTVKRERVNAVVVMRYAATLRDAAYAQVLWAIDHLGLSSEFDASLSPLEVRHKPSGMRIVFRGLDDPRKLKSLKFAQGEIGVLWIEEADTVSPPEIRSLLQTVMRSDNFRAIYTLNPPRHRGSWVNDPSHFDREDTLVHRSDYRDVPPEWLGQPFLDEVERLRERDEKSYRHEYLGEATGVGGVVFDNLTIRTITAEERAEFDRPLYGVDWGFDPDPWAFVEAHYKNGRLYIYGEATALKATNAETAQIILDRAGRSLVMCDGAEPKSIRDYRVKGIDARPAKKGAGSVEYGMKWLRSLTEIVIDPASCPVAAKEFSTYEHLRLKDGTYTSHYPDKDNHTIDALRYACSPLMNRA